MTALLADDFFLESDTARQLYEQHARDLPIIDYHCHIHPQDIADNKGFASITEAWLGGDHYKWRLMRANGVDERLITGDAGDLDKFRAFAACLPKALGNPIYHWTHLELRRYFGYTGVLNQDTADQVWELCNEQLPHLRVREIIRQSRVEAIHTTDEVCDSLAAHRQIREDPRFETQVLPGWRPDKAMNIRRPGFREFIDTLAQTTGRSIASMDDLCTALTQRLDYFAAAGCRVSDHGLDFVPFAPGREGEGARALSDALAGRPVTAEAAEAYQYALLAFLAQEYARRGWVMQLHYGALRNVNSAMFARLGPDTGYDCIGSPGDPARIAGLLDTLDRQGNLPKTILYSANGRDTAMLGTLIQCFQRDVPGKLQLGAAWWFNDTKSGIVQHLVTLAEQCLLGNFVGMLTDSRSFLSYTRHEYFRRLLCNQVAQWVDGKEAAMDPSVGRLIEDISYYNISRYIGD